MLRLWPVMLIASSIILLAPVWGQVIHIIPIQHADAKAIVNILGGFSASTETDAEVNSRFTRDTIERAIKEADGQNERPYFSISSSISPVGDNDVLVKLPAGLHQSPVALPDENAILVCGKTEAIDALKDIIQLFDRPIPMISTQLSLVDAMDGEVTEPNWDIRDDSGSVKYHTGGKGAVNGSSLHLGSLNWQIVNGFDHNRSYSRSTITANVTTLSGFTAIIRMGVALPFFTARVWYDAWGNRMVETDISAIFVGLELFVLPRIIGKNEVLLRIRPTFISWTGMVTAPDNQVLPIISKHLAETTVQLRSGESLAIGGWRRTAQHQLNHIDFETGDRRINDISWGIMTISPTIKWPLSR